MTDKTDVEIDVGVNGLTSLQRAADAISTINQSLRDTARSLTQAVSGLDRLERGLASAGRTGAQTFKSLSSAADDYAKSVKSFNMTPPRDARGRFVSQGFIDAVSNRAVANQQAVADRATLHNQEQLAKAREKNAEALRKEQRAYYEAAFASSKYGSGLEKLKTAIRTGTTDNAGYISSLAGTRYALYDVATTYGVISGALLGFTALSIKTAADFESAFTNVERTLDDTTQNSVGRIGEIRDNLIKLSETLPLTFEQIARIATLGNQLGIPSEAIEQFTENVAQFSAVTGITVDETARAFGSLGVLLNLTDDQYDNLGSSIAYVGRTSVATESEVIALAERLAASATNAGFTAKEVIGLSGAMASLRIAPERAQGVMETYFNRLNNALASGGRELQVFAGIAGLTEEEIRDLVKNDPYEFFRRFALGLNSLDTVSQTVALEELGLSGIRAGEVFGRLASNMDQVDKANANAEKSFSEGTELATQYAKVLDDFNSQWMILVNSINAFIAELSGGQLEGLAELVGLLAQGVQAATDFVATDIGRYLTGFISAAAIAAGLILAYRTAVALATASTFALITAQQGVAAAGLRGGIVGLAQAMGLLKVSTDAATTSTLTLGAALKALGKATIILAVLQLAYEILFDLNNLILTVRPALEPLINSFQGFFNVMANGAAVVSRVAGFVRALGGPLEELARIASAVAAVVSAAFRIISFASSSTVTGKYFNELANAGSTAIKTGKSFDSASNSAADFASNLGSVGSSAGGASKQLRTLVDYANDLSGIFSRTQDLRFGSQTAIDAVIGTWIELNEQLAEYQRRVLELSADKAIKEYFLSVAEAYGDSLRAGQLRSELADIEADLADAQAITNKTLIGNSSAAVKNRSVITGLISQYTKYIESLASSGADQTTLNAAINQSRAEFLAQAQALGFSTAELIPYVAAFSDLAYVIDTVPRDVDIEANVNPAITAIREFLAKLSSGGYGGGSVPVKVAPDFAAAAAAGKSLGKAMKDEVVKELNKIKQINKLKDLSKSPNIMSPPFVFLRGGGSVSGPGTATSDSINARLSDGEFVLRAASVAGLGTPLLNYMNKYGSLPGFANGGQVGPTVVTTSGGMVALVPEDRALLRAVAERPVVVSIGNETISRAAQSGDESRRQRGDLRA